MSIEKQPNDKFTSENNAFQQQTENQDGQQIPEISNIIDLLNTGNFQEAYHHLGDFLNQNNTHISEAPDSTLKATVPNIIPATETIVSIDPEIAYNRIGQIIRDSGHRYISIDDVKSKYSELYGEITLGDIGRLIDTIENSDDHRGKLMIDNVRGKKRLQVVLIG